jgi:hypothetical protein
MVQSQSWKNQERQIASDFGVQRNPNNGRAQSDLDVPGFSVESKKRAKLPAGFLAAMAQSRRNCKPGRLSVSIFSHVTPGRKAKRYAVLEYEDFLALHRMAYPAPVVVDNEATLPEPEGN